MTFREYQRAAARTAKYPNRNDLPGLMYVGLGLAGEAGECANIVKKWFRDDYLDREALIEEVGDVLWYCAMVATELDATLEEIAHANVLKLADRHSKMRAA